MEERAGNTNDSPEAGEAKERFLSLGPTGQPLSLSLFLYCVLNGTGLASACDYSMDFLRKVLVGFSFGVS